MKILLFVIALAVISSLSICFPQSAGTTPDLKDGAANGTCWKDADGNVVSLGVRGTVHGDQDITMSLGDESDETWGNPVLGGGCLESGVCDLGGHKYRVDDGSMERQNAAGDWVNMTEVPCPKKKTDPLNHPQPPPTLQDDSFGSLPGSWGGGSFASPML